VSVAGLLWGSDPLREMRDVVVIGNETWMPQYTFQLRSWRGIVAAIVLPLPFGRIGPTHGSAPLTTACPIHSARICWMEFTSTIEHVQNIA
jgi:hypothetical protein